MERNFAEDLDPGMVTQAVRGRLFNTIDMLMSIEYKQPDAVSVLAGIVDLLYNYIDFAVTFLNYFKNNTYLAEMLNNNKDLYLIDSKCEWLACYYEIILTLLRVLGDDSFNADFFILNGEHLKKMKVPVQTSRVCVDKAYSVRAYIEKKPTLPVSNFIDYFAHKQGYTLLHDIITSKSHSLGYDLPFEMIDMFLKPFVVVYPLVDYKDHFNQEVTSLTVYVKQRILKLTEAEIKETNINMIITCLQSIKNIMVADDKDRQNYFEELYVTYHYKCFSCKNMGKRIKGILALNLIIETVEKKESSVTRSKDDTGDVDGRIQNLDSKTLLNFL